MMISTQKPTVRPELRKAARFFFEHAGYIVGERLRCAVSLARAEAYGEARDWSVRWKDEPYADDSFMAEGETWNECLFASLFDTDDNCLASCGMIFDPSREYSRVMAAELMAEAMERDLRQSATFGIGKAA